MAAHKVKLALPEISVGNSKCTFDVYANEEKLGTFQISKGGLRWTPANSTHFKFKTWKKLKNFFEK